MATCGSLQHIFDKQLPESPTLLESLSSWKQIKSVKTIEDSSSSSYTEIFGELHFQEHHVDSSSSSSSPLPQSSSPSSTASSSSSFFTEIHPQNGNERLDKEKNEIPSSYYPRKQYRHSDSFSSMNSESLSLCTESLGFESSDDVEDLRNETSFDFQNQEEKTQSFSKHLQSENSWKESKRSKSKGSFPPPISCIGRTGKPWVCFKSYRQDGRFILQEIRIPTQEFLHACREDGRLRLQFIQSDDEILQEDEEEDDDDYDYDDVEKIKETNKKTNDDDDDKEAQDYVTNEENRGSKVVQISTIDASESSSQE
ncbi:hypothetical protein M9H77_16595 [Catharanthus roseus]|uniref:Uncharacterized protein n=1 Tax=Catharanthus roseus TaxID=4058 RepID=A0ACC0B2D3_CATRO|nr:hypothetical protein M9H77_16595 [Catharanthus roseus]